MLEFRRYSLYFSVIFNGTKMDVYIKSAKISDQNIEDSSKTSTYLLWRWNFDGINERNGINEHTGKL